MASKAPDLRSRRGPASGVRSLLVLARFRMARFRMARFRSARLRMALGCLTLCRVTLGGWILGPLTLGLLASACRSVESTAHNLRELHDYDGSLRHLSAPMNAAEFQFRESFAQLGNGFLRESLGPAAKSDRRIKRPAERTLKELNRLAKFDADDPRTAGLQVELATWFVADEPSALARERAASILANSTERLGVERIVQFPDDAEFVQADELGVLIVALFEAFDAGSTSSAARALDDLDAALERTDRDGARRLLFALNVQLKAPPRIEPAAERFFDLHERAQARCVALGLGTALEDPDERVQARAVEAVLRIQPQLGRDLYAQALARGLPEVLVTIGEHLAAHGLPEGSGLEAPAGEPGWLELLVQCTAAPDGPASVAACRALNRLAPVQLDTLRAEDWIVWWFEEGRAQFAPAAGGGSVQPAASSASGVGGEPR